jgi:hypothetical protein
MPCSCQVTLHYLRHVFEPYSRVPDVLRIDKDDRALLVTAGADVTEHGGWRNAPPFHLVFESIEKLATAPGTAAPFARGGAHEDLANPTHGQILCRRRDKSNEASVFGEGGFLYGELLGGFQTRPYGVEPF